MRSDSSPDEQIGTGEDLLECYLAIAKMRRKASKRQQKCNLFTAGLNLGPKPDKPLEEIKQDKTRQVDVHLQVLTSKPQIKYLPLARRHGQRKQMEHKSRLRKLWHLIYAMLRATGTSVNQM